MLPSNCRVLPEKLNSSFKVGFFFKIKELLSILLVGAPWTLKGWVTLNYSDNLIENIFVKILNLYTYHSFTSVINSLPRCSYHYFNILKLDFLCSVFEQPAMQPIKITKSEYQSCFVMAWSASSFWMALKYWNICLNHLNNGLVQEYYVIFELSYSVVL